MAVVNRVPRGLLGLLDAKTQGQTPGDTVGVLSPVIDLTPNYLADIPFSTAQASDIGFVTGTNFGVVEVPAGELWYAYVIGSEGIFSGVSTNNGDIVTVLVTPSGVVPVPLMSSGFAQAPNSLASESVTRVAQFPQPIIVGPGTQFATRIIQLPAAEMTCITNVIYRSVQV